MVQEYIAYSLAHHPAPYRHRISAAALLFALFGSAVACGADLMTDYALIGHACIPGREALATPSNGFNWVWGGVLGIHLATLAVIVCSGWVAYSIWQRTGRPRGHAHHLMERGEGRDRFFGIVGMAFAVMFFGITAAETLSMGMVGLCLH